MMKDENMNITITGMIGKRKEKALLKEAAEFLDVNFSDLLWVGDTPQQSVILDREG